MKQTHNRVKIHGAGISGLTAAINLARSGIEAEVMEKRAHIGGAPFWHPSVHHQVFDLEKTCAYIGIDVSPCFRPVKNHTFFFYGRQSKIEEPCNSYVCEKGPRDSSLENYLYKEALKAGVSFKFETPLDLETVGQKNGDTLPVVVATGLERAPYDQLGIKHATIHGYRSSTQAAGGDMNSVCSYFGHYTNHDFAYTAASGDLLFTLLFARKGVGRDNLDAFQQHLRGLGKTVSNDWMFSSGCVPLEKNLVKNGIVLAGTIGGMIDPFFLNGISAALISGKIAALYFTDPIKARKEFNRFTRNFHIKKMLKSIADRLPVKKYSFPLVVFVNNYLKWVGVV